MKKALAAFMCITILCLSGCYAKESTSEIANNASDEVQQSTIFGSETSEGSDSGETALHNWPQNAEDIRQLLIEMKELDSVENQDFIQNNLFVILEYYKSQVFSKPLGVFYQEETRYYTTSTDIVIRIKVTDILTYDISLADGENENWSSSPIEASLARETVFLDQIDQNSEGYEELASYCKEGTQNITFRTLGELNDSYLRNVAPYWSARYFHHESFEKISYEANEQHSIITAFYGPLISDSTDTAMEERVEIGAVILENGELLHLFTMVYADETKTNLAYVQEYRFEISQ